MQHIDATELGCLAVPVRWRSILAYVQAYAPEAVLAGGALRDLVFGVPPADLDIFVAAGPSIHSRLHVPLLYDWKRRRTIFFPYYAMRQRCVAFATEYEVPVFDLLVQIIELAFPDGFTIAHVLERMDFGACQIGFDGQRLHATVAAVQDIASRRVTLLLADDPTEIQHSLKRAERFRAKYAGTGIVVDTSFAEKVLQAQCSPLA